MSEALDSYTSWCPEPRKNIIQVLDIHCPLPVFCHGNQSSNIFCIKANKILQFMIISSLCEETRFCLFTFPPSLFFCKKQMEKKISDMFSCKDNFCFVFICSSCLFLTQSHNPLSATSQLAVEKSGIHIQRIMTFREEEAAGVNEVCNINPVFMQIYLAIKAKFHTH